VAEEEDRPGPAEREAAGITAKPEDFVRYVWARDRLREARRDLSEDTAREELLDAYEAGRIEARPGHNYRGPINVKLCRQSSKALEGTWWHAADLERRRGRGNLPL
jgi:hypothetical protein